MAKTHIIAVAGKGGVGKTTTCGMIIDYLCKQKKGPILVVDADANSNLNEVLGVEVETTLGDIREEMACILISFQFIVNSLLGMYHRKVAACTVIKHFNSNISAKVSNRISVVDISGKDFFNTFHFCKTVQALNANYYAFVVRPAVVVKLFNSVTQFLTFVVNANDWESCFHHVHCIHIVAKSSHVAFYDIQHIAVIFACINEI